MTTKTALFATLALCVGACTTQTGPDPQPRSEQVDEVVGVDEAGPLDSSLSIEQQLEQIQSRDPALYDQLLRLEPARTRARSLRFIDPMVREAETTPIFIHRLQTTGEDQMVRAALAEALPRTGGDWSRHAVGLIEAETDDWVRGALVVALRTADADAALAGLRLGLADAAPEIRAAAAMTTSRRPDGSELVAELTGLLADDDLAPRLEAIRALGALGATEALGALPAHLDSNEADERLHALRAIDRIDPSAAVRLAQLDALAADSDPRVARAANEIAARR